MTQERKRKPNIIDFVILLAMLAVLSAVVFRIFIHAGVQDQIKIRYVLEVEQIQTEFCSKVAAGDLAFDYESAAGIGTVSAVSAAPAYFKGTDREGNPVYTEMDGYSMLYITVEADAVQSDTGYQTGGYTIHAGEMLSMQFPGLYCEAECISVDVIE